MTPRRIALASVLTLVLACVSSFGLGYWSRGSTHDEDARPTAVDIGFCQDMAVHHAQAVVMAQDAIALSRTPAVVAIAKQILITQSEERGTMAGWLTDWDEPQLPDGPPMTWMSHATMPDMAHGATTMPGMATADELVQLGRTHGAAFDKLFLELMIRHHLGGLLMATDAQQHAGLNEVRALAGAMLVDQTQENTIMKGLLLDMQ